MRLLLRILNRVAIIRVEYASDGAYQACVSIVGAEVEEEGDWEQARKMLCAVVVCGSGVIAKPDQLDIAIRVRADNELFLHSSSKGQTIFVRRDRLFGLFAELTERNVVPVQIFCVDASTDDQAVCIQCTRQIQETLHWRDMIKMTEVGSAIAQAFVRRVGLPVLGLFMLLLMANVLLASRLNSNKQQLRIELETRQHSSSESKSIGDRQRVFLAQFLALPPTPYALICDRIAAATPESVKLASLEIWPLAKRFESGKPLICRERVAIVGGYAPSSGDVSLFANRLSELTFCQSVKLANLEKERDGNRLQFKIEIEL